MRAPGDGARGRPEHRAAHPRKARGRGSRLAAAGRPGYPLGRAAGAARPAPASIPGASRVRVAPWSAPFACATLALATAGFGAGAAAQEVDARARVVPHDTAAFGPDPSYPGGYDPQAQLDVYGGKRLNPTQRPLLELGRDLYAEGPLERAPNLLGSHNVLVPQLLVYGDLRTGAGYNTAGEADDGRWASRLNLEVDLKLTATERIHALFRPLEEGGEFTRYDFTGDEPGFETRFDGEPAALFFEGDLGAILGGLTGRDAPFDLPVAAGLMPLLFHNGVWLEDAFTGAAFTIPARNSTALDWSNFDVSFFAGVDRVSNPALGAESERSPLVGANLFVEAYRGYLEAGYAFVGDEAGTGRELHSAAVSFTKRYGRRLSNSVRWVGAFAPGPAGPADGEGPGGEAAPAPEGGHLLLVENSLITSRPSTVVPYLNLFFAYGSPVSLARDPGAGGILKNTGLAFEADPLTGFPSLAPSPTDALGGALGLEVLGGGLDRQLVVEVAGTWPWQDSPLLPGAQYAVGLRAQQALGKALILRVDGMLGRREGLTDLRGVRLELRHKF